jgi:hypothetical protein
VFGDDFLAAHIRELEKRYRPRQEFHVRDTIAQAIAERYATALNDHASSCT